jgi:hypothetical protein
MCLVNEMRAQFFNPVMRLEGTFQNFQQRKFLTSNIKSQLCVEYEKSRSPLNDKIVMQLESYFLGVTSQQVKQLFHSWENNLKNH